MTCNIAMTVHNLLELAQAIARRLARLPQDVDDITQEALLKLVAKPKHLFAALHSPAYVHATVRSACADFYRSNNRQERIAYRSHEFADASFVAEPVVHEEYAQYLPFDKLTSEHRQVLNLRAQGLRYQQIAEITKTSVGTVRSRIYYGRRQMQKLLSENN